MEIKNVGSNDYDKQLRMAKDSTVYAHANVWVRNIMEDKRKTEREKFLEIHKIVIEATNHLSDDE